jgi:hypothetical protein
MDIDRRQAFGAMAAMALDAHATPIVRSGERLKIKAATWERQWLADLPEGHRYVTGFVTFIRDDRVPLGQVSAAEWSDGILGISVRASGGFPSLPIGYRRSEFRVYVVSKGEGWLDDFAQFSFVEVPITR